MVNFVVILIFLGTLFVNGIALVKIDLRRLQFIDGTLIGMTYFLTIPMIVILVSGRVGGDFLSIPDYRPYEDLKTTFSIEGGMFLLGVLKLVLSGVYRRRLRSERTPLDTGVQLKLLVITASIYVIATTTFFIQAGIGSGGHWYKASQTLMESGTVFVLLRNIANFARTAVFGCMIPLLISRPQLRNRLVILGGVLVLIDLALTLNRITVLYYLLFILVIFQAARSHWICCAPGYSVFRNLSVTSDSGS